MRWPCRIVDRLEDLWSEDGGERHVGAMAWWRHSRHANDTAPRLMPHLAVMTPGGVVCLDCPATGPGGPGRYWARTGEPPAVTVTPSLDVAAGSGDHWHGWVQQGYVTEVSG